MFEEPQIFVSAYEHIYRVV